VWNSLITSAQDKRVTGSVATSSPRATSPILFVAEETTRKSPPPPARNLLRDLYGSGAQTAARDAKAQHVEASAA